MIETIIICTIFGVFLIVSFVIGARVGQKIVKGEEVKLTPPNPITVVKEHHESKELQKELDREQEKLQIMMENIENYDGTGTRQQVIGK